MNDDYPLFTDPCVYEQGTFISADSVLRYAYLTNDVNTIHIVDADAVKAGFERAIVHGMLTASFISSALTDHFGEGTIYVAQNIKFIKPVLINSVIIVKLFNPFKISETSRKISLDTMIWIENKKRKGGVDSIEHELCVIGNALIIPGKKST